MSACVSFFKDSLHPQFWVSGKNDRLKKEGEKEREKETIKRTSYF
jgi:hypothetical protein